METNLPPRTIGFVDYALVSLHCRRIYLDTSYRTRIDLLKEMPQITGEVVLGAADLSAPSTLTDIPTTKSRTVCARSPDIDPHPQRERHQDHRELDPGDDVGVADVAADEPREHRLQGHRVEEQQ